MQHRVRFALLLLLCWLLCDALVVAASPDHPVVRVGPAVVTAGELERRLSALPGYQLAALGSTPEQARIRFVQEAVVPELLFELEARAEQLERDPAVEARIRALLAEAVIEDIRRELLQSKAISDEEVRARFEAERARLGVPRRIRIFRILVEDEAKARQIIGDARGPGGLAKWATHAREQSLDRATHMRKGDLGFVRPDGTTDVPTVRVDPVLFMAADQVQDGELVPEPVREGKRFAAVWRRGSLPAREPSFEEEAPAIRRELERQRLEQEVNRLVSRLRKRYLALVSEAMVDQVKMEPFPSLSLPPRPVASVRPAVTGAPQPGLRGLR